MILVHSALDEAAGKFGEKTDFALSIRAEDLAEMITTYLAETGQTLSAPTRRKKRKTPSFGSGPVLLRRHDVEAMTGLPRSTIYLHIKQGTFPRPVKLSTRSVGWIEAEITEWIQSKVDVGNCLQRKTHDDVTPAAVQIMRDRADVKLADKKWKKIDGVGKG